MYAIHLIHRHFPYKNISRYVPRKYNEYNIKLINNTLKEMALDVYNPSDT